MWHNETGFAMYQPEFNATKFGDLMLYLAHRCQDVNHFGATKLCKLLYYSDFNAFARTGSPITGADYMRQDHGPMPREFYWQRHRLIEAGRARLEMRVVLDHDEDRLVPLVGDSYYDGLFSRPEFDAIERALDLLSDMTAERASEHSRGEVGWKMAKDEETIPYEAAYIVPRTDVELHRVIDKAFANWVRHQDGE